VQHDPDNRADRAWFVGALQLRGRSGAQAAARMAICFCFLRLNLTPICAAGGWRPCKRISELGRGPQDRGADLGTALAAGNMWAANRVATSKRSASNFIANAGARGSRNERRAAPDEAGIQSNLGLNIRIPRTTSQKRTSVEDVQTRARSVRQNRNCAMWQRID